MTPAEQNLAELAQRQFDVFRNDVLARHSDGRVLGHHDGYVPLLVQFTREDGAARGLRRMSGREAGGQTAEHLSVLEAIQQADTTLLEAPCGWGKTTFARHLVLNLAGDRLGDPTFNVANLRAPVPRHDGGVPEAQVWTLPAMWPVMVDAARPGRFTDVVAAAWPGYKRWRGTSPRPPVLVVVDHVETMGDAAQAFLEDAGANASADLRVVILADRTAAEHWRVPETMVRHRLVPLNRAQRDGADPAAPGLAPVGFHMAARAIPVRPVSVDELADRWLGAHAHLDTDRVGSAVLAAVRSGTWPVDGPVQVPRHLGELIAASALSDAAPGTVAAAFADAPVNMTAVVASVFRRWDETRRDTLANALLLLPGDAGRRGALAAADHAAAFTSATRQRLREVLLPVVVNGLLAPAERIRAGSALSTLGDPRDLAELVQVQGASFRMGSDNHPNSRPTFEATVSDFRISRFPVSSGLFAAFAIATGHNWRTGHGLRPDHATAPAVDVSWHDARAYCEWATHAWRRDGRIGRTELVRLPTEPEWERAARGDLDGSGPVFPWGLAWRDDCANADPIGHNATCAVGLFPAGASPFGCLDMAGQVWEWTSTLWGSAMETPLFRYPYRADDGREHAGAGADIRRVLRGGCFTGGPAKANCTYRGSLEPAGTWRGNGFRVVVAREVP